MQVLAGVPAINRCRAVVEKEQAMNNDTTIAASVESGDDSEWYTAWQGLVLGLDLAREITRLIKNRQTMTVNNSLLALTESDYFRVASGVTEDHLYVQRGQAALLARHSARTVEFEQVWSRAEGGVAKGHVLHALIAGVLSEMVEEFGGSPDVPIGSDERIRQESIWCWCELVLAGLNGRESVGSSSYEPNQGVYPNKDTQKARKEWALRRTGTRKNSSEGEKWAARDLVLRIGGAIEPAPQQVGPADSLSVLDQMLPPNLAVATRRRLARYSGTPKLTAYQAEASRCWPRRWNQVRTCSSARSPGVGSRCWGSSPQAMWSAGVNSGTATGKQSSPCL
jgi:hypothetical protein